MKVYNFGQYFPKIHSSVYISDNARVIGNVEIGQDSSVWFGAVVRGDVCFVKVGRCSNIQDNAVIHVNHSIPTIIGDYVTVGHNAIVHGATISDYVIVGMGSILLDNVKVGRNVIIGAGTLITPRTEIPDGVLVLGSPAKVVRELSQEEIEKIKTNAMEYVELARLMKT
ncbi:MAG: gamma carbonic anhydrase family protein [Spirochaetia bacterium]|nr:gamma carbonic anhydrase family protein [Spirochaetota bacterium]MCX8097348.1 gamma carbonic anhydrase family protein [Spirochaetota bacterium]MDW8112013.1 gamma carbonic anhydrase family protein [Spirochaetia bacterium]